MRHYRSKYSGLTLVSCLFFSIVAAGQVVTITVDGSSHFQTIDGFGFSGAFGAARALHQVTPAEQRQVLDSLFSPTAGAGFTILRNWAPAEPANGTIEPVSPGAPSLPPQYVWDHDSVGQVWLSQQAQTYGVNRFYLDAWDAPPFMTSTPTQFFGGTLCAGLSPGCSDDWRQAYANYLVQYVRFYQTDGINITHLGAFNEPDFAGSGSPGAQGQPGMLMNSSQAADFIKFLRPTLSAAGFSTRVVCCDRLDFNLVQGDANAITADPSANSGVDVISGHGYKTAGVALPVSAPGKSIWMTEWFDKDDAGQNFFDTQWDDGLESSGFGQALILHRSLAQGNASAYIYWQGVQFGQSTNNSMLVQDDFTTGVVTVTKRLWALANYSRYIHPGAVRIGASTTNGNLLVSAYQNIDGSVAVVALNQSSTTMWPTFRLQNVGAAFSGSATPVLTDSFNNVVPQPSVVVENGLLSSQVPPRALVTFVLTPGTPPAAGRFIDQLSNMCLGVPSGSQTPGVTLVQYFCNGSADQNWIRDVNSGIVSGGLTYYRWVDQISGLCLGVTAGSTAPGASVMQWPCYNAADQHWAKQDIGGGFSRMINFSSGLCLGVKSGSRSANAPIITWSCNGSGDQNWRFTGQ